MTKEEKAPHPAGGLAIHFPGDGRLTVDATAMGNVDIDVITAPGGKVKISKKHPDEPPGEQTDGANVINASVDEHAYRIGDVLPDGWIVGPVSPTTGKPIAIKPVTGDLKGHHGWGESLAIAEDLRGRLPNIKELKTIFGHAKCIRHEWFDGNPDLGPFVWSSTDKDRLGWGVMIYDIDSAQEGWIDARLETAHALVVRDQPDITLEP